MGSEEHNTTVHRKVSTTLSELEESFEEKEKKEKEKEYSISHRNLVKIESLAIGEQYIGEIKDNKREGQGTCIYKNGDKYEGFWKNNKKEGKEYITLHIRAKFIKEIFLMIIRMEKEFIIIKMVINMKECLKMGKNMERG